MRAQLIFATSLLLFLVSVFTHELQVEMLLDNNLSWTFSALLPYFIAVALIIITALSLSQFVHRNPVYRKFISIISVFVLAGGGFAMNPIYEGDFSNNMEQLEVQGNIELFPEGISMIALPGCKYCYGQIPIIKKLMKRNPSLKISIVFVLKDELTIEDYQEQLGERVSILVSDSPQLVSEIVNGKYPSYVARTADDKMVYKWSVAGLGAVGLDRMENLFQP